MTRHHILLQAARHGKKTALITQNLGVWSYADLCARASGLSNLLLQGKKSLNGQRIALMCERSGSYVIAQWAIWASGGIAVPLHSGHPTEEIKYVLEDCAASKIITDFNHIETIDKAAKHCQVSIQMIEEAEDSTLVFNSNNFSHDKMAQILYTSGTTGKPKGVVASHKNLTAQVGDLVEAWQISNQDQVMHFLPLHHVHGIVNNLLVPLYAGARVHMLPNSDSKLIWENMGQSTVLMAVPTIYHKLVECYDSLSENEKSWARKQARRLRLCISGSMSCPIPLIKRWEQLTGHRLLERYGMTELGMVLSHPLNGLRHPGYVGLPLPSVDVKLGGEFAHLGEGELLVKGDTVFHSYWNRPDATRNAFDNDGWFKTGDLVEFSNEKQSYRILGRMSVDILKSAGYKLSAVEIEAVLLECSIVAECYVLGIPDDKWGQVVAAVIRLIPNTLIKGETIYHSYMDAKDHIDRHARSNLADYKVPRRYIFRDKIPKNTMGKVNKKELLASILADDRNASLDKGGQSQMKKYGMLALVAAGLYAFI